MRIMPSARYVYNVLESNKRRPHINAAAIIRTLWAWLHAYSKSDRERSVDELKRAGAGLASKRSFENIMAKLKVVACAEGESSRGAARRFGVDEKRVREWRKSNKTAEIAGRGQRKNAITGRRKDRIYG